MGKRGPPKGSPKSGGRKKGTPNKATADIRDLAREYTLDAVATIVAVMRSSDSDQARVAAAREILDRGYGKAPQFIAGDKENPIEIVLRGAALECTAKLNRLSQPE